MTPDKLSNVDETTFPLNFALTPSDELRHEMEREEILADPGFGKHFTDHMVTIGLVTRPGLARCSRDALRPHSASILLPPSCTTVRKF